MSTSTKKTNAKQLVSGLLCDLYGKISMTRGKGTGSGWYHIRTDISVPHDVRTLVQYHLIKNQLCSTWWPDMASEPDACVGWYHENQ